MFFAIIDTLGTLSAFHQKKFSFWIFLQYKFFLMNLFDPSSDIDHAFIYSTHLPENEHTTLNAQKSLKTLMKA